MRKGFGLSVWFTNVELTLIITALKAYNSENKAERTIVDRIISKIYKRAENKQNNG